MPFGRLKVRLKKEIVTMKVPGIDPSRDVGRYVDPADWNAVIADPGTVVIDTRNDYETAIGIFKGAVDPQTKTFREFPDWVRNNTGLHNKPKIAMYCTGGIRCEVLSSLMVNRGFSEVYQLDGGIVRYGEKYGDSGLWQGSLYVFDNRMSIDFSPDPAVLGRCYACDAPTKNMRNCVDLSCREQLV
eukprot:gene14800-18077_t